MKELSKFIDEIREDVKATMEGDPAARSAWEVLILYQGIHALIAYRIAHRLWKKGFYFIARLISQISRHFTQIEIHPGATIGRGTMIDHGCGVVIGETTIIGDHCRIYQGVTLGGQGHEKGKRHPTLGNNVTVGAGAKILGSFEVGDNCTIAANAVLLKPIKENVTVAGIPAKPVKVNGIPVEKKKHVYTTDIVAMNERLAMLENKLADIEHKIDEKEI